MQNIEEFDILAEGYLSNKLTIEQTSSFENQLKSNGELQSRFEELKNMRCIVKEAKLLEIKNLLSEKHTLETKDKSTKKYITATLVVLLLASLYFIYDKGYNHSNTTLVKERKPIKDTNSYITTNDEPEDPKQITTNTPKTTPTQNSKTPIKKDSVTPRLFVETKRHTDSIIPTSKSNPRPILPQISIQELPVKQKENIDPCHQTLILSDLKTQPSCYHDASGSMVLSNIRGGNSPYEVTLKNEKGITLEDLNHLAMGKYKIMIQDALFCKSEISVEIRGKVCSQNWALNPNTNETIELPECIKNGIFVVSDRNGKVYFKKNILAFEKTNWDGKSNDGDFKSGLYTFYIKFDDETLMNGTITLLE